MDCLRDESVLLKLHSTFPGREREITKLWRLLGNRCGPTHPTLVYGVSGVGKTSVVRAVVAALHVRHAYICCTQSGKPQQIQQSILSQLKSTTRTQDTAYTAGPNAEHTADFIQQLGGLCPVTQPPALIIIDRAENAVSSSWLPALLRARELCDEGVSISVILISRHAWGSGTFVPFGRLYPMHMKAYTQEQLEAILLQMASVRQPNVPLYSMFIQNVIISTFGRLTRNCQDLHQLASALFPHYKQAAKQEPSDLPLDRLHRRLYGNHQFQRVLNATLKAYQPGCPVQVRLPHLYTSSLDFELSLLGKWLLLAAYIASRNKPTLDRQVFDGSVRSGKMRGRGGRAMDLQADAAAEALMKGPHGFPLRRLMLIHDALLRSCGVTGSQDVTEEDDDGLSLAAAATLASITKTNLGSRLVGPGPQQQNPPSSSLPSGPGASKGHLPGAFSPTGKRFRTSAALLVPDDDDNDDDNPTPGKPHPATHTGPHTRRMRSSRGRSWSQNGAEDGKWKPKGLQPQEDDDGVLNPGACSFYHQLTSLVNLRFLSQGGEDVVEGPKYYCTISDEVAQQIAHILKVDLSKYIRYQ